MDKLEKASKNLGAQLRPYMRDSGWCVAVGIGGLKESQSIIVMVADDNYPVDLIPQEFEGHPVVVRVTGHVYPAGSNK